MKRVFFIIACLCLALTGQAQDKKPVARKDPPRNDLVSLKKCILDGQANVILYRENLKDHSKEHDVNSIILDIEKYIDSMHRVKTTGDQLLMKNFNPLRHFFLTTTNKTTVATFFLYPNVPYQFCLYNDTATALYIGAVKDGSLYNLGKTTERRIMKFSFENCLLPSLKALDEFKDNEPKYIALSVYYGCKDTREGAGTASAAYCLTFVARTADLQQYAAGIFTMKGLMANSEIYWSDEETAGELRRIQLTLD